MCWLVKEKRVKWQTLEWLEMFNKTTFTKERQRWWRKNNNISIIKELLNQIITQPSTVSLYVHYIVTSFLFLTFKRAPRIFRISVCFLATCVLGRKFLSHDAGHFLPNNDAGFHFLILWTLSSEFVIAFLFLINTRNESRKWNEKRLIWCTVRIIPRLPWSTNSLLLPQLVSVKQTNEASLKRHKITI